MCAVKGVVLAGGTGTRLHPLTRITNKHLLPIYDRPMVTYAIEAMVGAGISEIMLVTGGTHAGEFLRLLGNGHEYGIDRLFYAYQDHPGGIAEALGLAERFVGGDRMVVMLADNILERSIALSLRNFAAQPAGARILLSSVEDPAHLRHVGVPALDGEGGVTRNGGCSNIAGTGTVSINSICTNTTAFPNSFAAVTGGAGNQALKTDSSVTGGQSNLADDPFADAVDSLVQVRAAPRRGRSKVCLRRWIAAVSRLASCAASSS